MKKDGRMDVLVMGRRLGSADGWDQADDHAVIFYDFKTAVDNIRSGETLLIDFEAGVVQLDDDAPFDLVPILANIPIKV